MPNRDAEVADTMLSANTASPALLKVTGLAKSFGPTQALRDGTFELHRGEIVALVGENGSGKSTLVKILSGVHSPDAGTIAVQGQEYARLDSPRTARRLGIVTVFQEVLVAESRSVLDNIWLGADGLLRRGLPKAEKARRASELLAELLETPPNLSTPVEDLSLSDRQACTIARALLQEPRLLILDEATSALDVGMRDRLFVMVRRMTAQEAGVIFITHRMDEVTELGDRVIVMRNGSVVGNLSRSEANPRALVHLMTGAEGLAAGARPERRPADGPVLLRARKVQLGAGLAPFDVEVRAGEILGLAGLEGHGQEQFLDSLRGIRTPGGRVDRVVGGREVRIASRQAAAGQGIAYVPRERGQAIFRWMSILENFGMPTLAADRRRGLLNKKSTSKRFAEYVKQIRIVVNHEQNPITSLSGGNQQKVIVARWLAARPTILLLNDPTRGIDINAKNDLYRLLTELADAGMAVVMLSTEIDELVELMDRVIVFREGTATTQLTAATLSRERLISDYFGEMHESKPQPAAEDGPEAQR